MSQAASYTPSPAALPSASPADSKPEVLTRFDDRGFTTLVTLYPGTTPAPTANILQNAQASNGPVAPLAAQSAGTRLFDGVWMQLLSAIVAVFYRHAW